MKKALLLLAFVGSILTTVSAQVVCTPDSTHFTSTHYVYPDTLPCIQRNQPFSGFTSLHVPDSVDGHNFVAALPAGTQLHIDSVHIDSINGLPNGIHWTMNPATHTVRGGKNGCVVFSGTTTDITGAYPLNIYGKGCGHATIFGSRIDSCVGGSLGMFFNFSLNVCDTAHHTGISDFTEGLNLNIYPNPNHGSFTLNLSVAERLVGELSVTDAIGRTIYTQTLDVLGTNSIPLQLGNLASGTYLLSVKDAQHKSVRQFIVD